MIETGKFYTCIRNWSYDGWCQFIKDEVYECKHGGMLIDRFDIERCIEEPDKYFRLATEEEIQDMIEDKKDDGFYEGVELCDGDYEGVTLQFYICGRKVSDIRISKYQSIELIKDLASYLKENV